eukprot:114219-Pyramimonas_sp.AAC.1
MATHVMRRATDDGQQRCMTRGGGFEDGRAAVTSHCRMSRKTARSTTSMGGHCEVNARIWRR